MKTKILLTLILTFSFLLRSYRVSDFLGFWYDQGRDALEIWQFIRIDHKPFLIGPTTGIEGIFLGPFYYNLLTPFYLIGNGNPVVPAIGLALISTAAVYLLFRIGADFFNTRTGLIAALLYGLSYQFVLSNRWLSNPTPLPFFALSALWCILKITSGSKNSLHWSILGLALGLGLQLEAASAVFFIPAAALILFANRKSLTFSRFNLIQGILPFGLTLLPQLIFNFRHENILFNSFRNFLFTETSFRPSLTSLLPQRLSSYYSFFTDKFYTSDLSRLVFTVFSCLLILFTITKKGIKVLLIWWLTPAAFLLFYHGNKGYVWDYYFTGAYPALVLLIAVLWSSVFNTKILRLAVLILITIFLFQNIKSNLEFLFQKNSPYISLTSITQAIDWVYSDAGGEKFNYDAYVPPMIPYAYDYVFLWRGTTVHYRQPEKDLVRRLYTIIEPDPGHQPLLDAWVFRQSLYSSVDYQQVIGQLTVQRRVRHTDKLP